MKKLLPSILIATFVTFGGNTCADEPQPVLPGKSPSVRQVTLGQIYRYAREMYRYGNYPEAVKAFKQMLAIDCSSPVAQYHLIKLAKKSPEYAELDAYLKNLPCPRRNFEEEDFLPASLYYENDPALMQEQLGFYNKRYRIAKDSLQSAADNYAKLTKELEDEIGGLRQKLTAATDGSAKERASLNEQLSASREAAIRMDQEVAKLKEQLVQARARRQEAADLVDNGLAKGTNAGLQQKKFELEAKDKELTTIQQKFDDIQTRLRAIQASIEEKNTTIKSLQAVTAEAATPQTQDKPANKP